MATTTDASTTSAQTIRQSLRIGRPANGDRVRTRTAAAATTAQPSDQAAQGRPGRSSGSWMKNAAQNTEVSVSTRRGAEHEADAGGRARGSRCRSAISRAARLSGTTTASVHGTVDSLNPSAVYG